MDEVSTWLGEIHLSNHIPNFERNGITGARLAELTDRELRDQLRVVKPSELMALKGAITTLQHPPPRKGSGHGQSRTMTTVGRDPSGSPRDLPKAHTLSAIPGQRIPKGIVERSVSRTPDLRNGSAPELLDDKCRYSGWIRKQGGGHKNCECLSVRVRAVVGSAVLVVEGLLAL